MGRLFCVARLGPPSQPEGGHQHAGIRIVLNIIFWTRVIKQISLDFGFIPDFPKNFFQTLVRFMRSQNLNTCSAASSETHLWRKIGVRIPRLLL